MPLLPIKRWILLTAVLCITGRLLAQSHDNAWFRGTLSMPAGKTIKIDAELQHRRQNGAGNFNMLDKKLMFSARSWIHYQYRRNIRFSLSPFAYFFHYKIIRHPADELAPPFREIRFSAAAELQTRVVKDLDAALRTAVEYRVIENLPCPMTRLRNRLMLRYSATRNLQVYTYWELFLNVPGAGSSRPFDHNRLSAGLDYSILPNLRLELGYIYIMRQPPGNDLIYENNLFVSLTHRLSRHARQTPKPV